MTPEKLSENGFSDLGEWLVMSLSSMATACSEAGNDGYCLHIHTLTLTQEEFDQLEVDTLLGDIGRDSTH